MPLERNEFLKLVLALTTGAGLAALPFLPSNKEETSDTNPWLPESTDPVETVVWEDVTPRNANVKAEVIWIQNSNELKLRVYLPTTSQLDPSLLSQCLPDSTDPLVDKEQLSPIIAQSDLGLTDQEQVLTDAKIELPLTIEKNSNGKPDMGKIYLVVQNPSEDHTSLLIPLMPDGQPGQKSFVWFLEQTTTTDLSTEIIEQNKFFTLEHHPDSSKAILTIYPEAKIDRNDLSDALAQNKQLTIAPGFITDEFFQTAEPLDPAINNTQKQFALTNDRLTFLADDHHIFLSDDQGSQIPIPLQEFTNLLKQVITTRSNPRPTPTANAHDTYLPTQIAKMSQPLTDSNIMALAAARCGAFAALTLTGFLAALITLRSRAAKS